MDEETKESERVGAGELFRGHQFYIARTMRSERRAELRILISQNGGDVVPEMTGAAVEIVEREQLRPGENWVAAGFVEDSIRDGELKQIVEYMAFHRQPRTPSGRRPKKFFTVEERAKMLQFLHDHHPKYYMKRSVPERIWRDAEEQNLLDRTAQSMHEHYRKQLALLTKRERAVLFENAGMNNVDNEETPHRKEVANDADENQEAEPEVASANVKQMSGSEAKSEDGGIESSSDDIQGRARKRRKRSTADSTDKVDQVAPAEREQQPQEGPAQVQNSPHGGSDLREDEAEEEEAKEQGGEDQEQKEAEDQSGEVFHSYWRSVISNRTRRAHLDRFFVPPAPTATDFPQSSNLVFTSRSSSSLRTPQRSRRLSHERPAPFSTPTPQKRRRSLRSSTDSLHTPGPRSPAQAAQHELLSQLEEMVGQRMTPPSRRKSLDRLIPVTYASENTADELLSRLRFITGHDLNTLCSALYWAGGATDIAREFLLGHSPPEMWTPADDSLLADYMREDITEVDIANASFRGAFERMSTKRSTRDIVRRIQFLL